MFHEHEFLFLLATRLKSPALAEVKVDREKGVKDKSKYSGTSEQWTLWALGLIGFSMVPQQVSFVEKGCPYRRGSLIRGSTVSTCILSRQ